MAKTVQDLARQKEIDEVQEEIRRTIQKIDESFAKKEVESKEET